MDFTILIYRKLLETLFKQGFSFHTFIEIIENQGMREIVMRHDVDKLPENSLRFARIQSEMRIRGTYYFRIVQESFNKKIIKEIYSLGHEVGYHYEDLSFAWAKLKAQGMGHRAQGTGLRAQGEELERLVVNIGIESFKANLEKLRKIVPVKTICMHGSPLSRWDSRLLWKYYDYHNFGIIGEPYFDIDFNEVLYLTDTGRRWDGDLVSIRDKPIGGGLKAEGGNPYQGWKVKPIKHQNLWGNENLPFSQPPLLPLFPSFHSTFDIIKAAEEGSLTDKIMITFHPQRWTDKSGPWIKELVWQNVKNMGKYFLVKMRD